ncbi:hypothetical protein RFI_28110 [Reticulomyxa filosa]|uniref:Uncharacterized protein n=1 Tax=Reticulomyxa filosa TaxID=46433 RepID=X6M6M1_RETFI|nr:hypothetical protein RFI_28110 [Reticulomyxa filosa]|eukprot:ETO09276.1 hypothetical protein RFI_28110 [Reticulomyxa filosa]
MHLDLHYHIGISLSLLIRTASIQLHRNCSITAADLSRIYYLCQENEMRENGEDKHGNGDKDKYREEEEEKEKPADVKQTQINIDFLQQPLMIEYLYTILHKYVYLLDYALCQFKINVNNGHDNVIIKEQRNELINDLTNISTQICHDKNYDGYFNSTYESYFAPLFLSLLTTIIQKYSFLVWIYFNIYVYMYDLIHKRCNVAELMDEMISIPKGLKALKEMEILQKLLDMLIFMLQHGEYKIVLDIMLSKHFAKLDRTLLRHFIQCIISTISPHVPSDFINRLFDIFKHENSMNAIKNDNVMKDDLLAFVENVRTKQMKYFPDKIKQVIEMIKSDTQSTY